MPLGNFYEIMIAIVGAPQNDVQATLIYLVSIILGAGTIMFVYRMFDIVAGFIKP